jgi:hypothetical protein
MAKAPRHWSLLKPARCLQLEDFFLGNAQPQTREILELVDRFGHRNCKDSRDKIYGLLGLSHTNSIEVNYQRSPASVCWSAWAAYPSAIGLKINLEEMVSIGRMTRVTGRETECSAIAGRRFSEAFNIHPSEAFAPRGHAVVTGLGVSSCRCGFMTWTSDDVFAGSLRRLRQVN